MRTAIMFGALALLAPILCAQRQVTGLVVQSRNYNPETNNVTLTLVNVSGKDIIAYNISTSDGSTDLLGRPNLPGEQLEDSLGSLIIEQMTGEKPPKDQPYGPIAAGATRSVIVGAKDIAVVDLVVYADATAEVLNEHAFSQIVAVRKGSLMATQKVSGALHRVLEDATITNPNAAAAEELKRELVEAKKLNNPEKAEGNRAVGCKALLPTWRGISSRSFFGREAPSAIILKNMSRTWTSGSRCSRHIHRSPG